MRASHFLHVVILSCLCLFLFPLKAQAQDPNSTSQLTTAIAATSRQIASPSPVSWTLPPGDQPSSSPIAAQGATSAGSGILDRSKKIEENLQLRGIVPHLTLKSEGSGAFASAIGAQTFDARSLLELGVQIDLKRAVNWQGATLYASMHSSVGSNGSEELTGDTQVYSNISAPPGTKLFEMWMQQELLNGKLRAKVGRIDANTEFAFVENAGGFLNSSMGYSPTIAGMPTYPLPRLGAGVFLKSRDRYYLSGGIFQNQPNGAMAISEADLRWKFSSSEFPGRLAYGYWRHTQAFPDQHGNLRSGAAGSYVVAEQTLWRPHLNDGGARSLGAYVQFGTSDPWADSMDRHVGAGMQLTGPLSRRPNDAVGLALSMVHLQPRDAAMRDHERSAEAFYRVQLKKWLSVTADMQFIDHPSGEATRPRAVVGTLRSVVSF